LGKAKPRKREHEDFTRGKLTVAEKTEYPQNHYSAIRKRCVCILISHPYTQKKRSQRRGGGGRTPSYHLRNKNLIFKREGRKRKKPEGRKVGKGNESDPKYKR